MRCNLCIEDLHKKRISTCEPQVLICHTKLNCSADIRFVMLGVYPARGYTTSLNRSIASMSNSVKNNVRSFIINSLRSSTLATS